MRYSEESISYPWCRTRRLRRSSRAFRRNGDRSVTRATQSFRTGVRVIATYPGSHDATRFCTTALRSPFGCRPLDSVKPVNIMEFVVRGFVSPSVFFKLASNLIYLLPANLAALLFVSSTFDSMTSLTPMQSMDHGIKSHK